MKNKLSIFILLMLIFAGCSTDNDDTKELNILSIVQQVKNNYANLEKHLKEDQFLVYFYIDDFKVIFDFNNYSYNGNSEYFIPFSVIDKNSFQTITDVLFWVPKEDQSGILLSFDDNFNWVPYSYIFEHANVSATFFFLGTTRRNDAVFLQNKGHEIGWHTDTHIELTNLNQDNPEHLARFDFETIERLEMLTQDTNLIVNNFAYPYGSYAPWMNERLSNRFFILRGFSRQRFYIYSIEALKQGGFIMSKGIDILLYDNSNGGRSNNFRIHTKKMFMVTKFVGGVLPINGHEILYSTENQSNAWAIMAHDLEYLIRVGKELKLRFYKFNDFIE